jgi:hypothetical protein
VKAIKDLTIPWCKYGQVIRDTKIVLNTWRSWMTGHVRREANFAAHGLAKATLMTTTDIVLDGRYAPCILTLFL